MKDGGPAYPSSHKATPADFPAGTWKFEYEGSIVTYPGLSRREWYAGQALVGLLAAHQGQAAEKSVVAAAFLIADAMLTESQK